jgi:murein DD-endopeptidase MepM/ murein hydrolase activator NlpD
VSARLARAALLAIAACAACRPARPPLHAETPPGSWHVVGPGETLDEIAARAGVPAEDILEVNGLERDDVTPSKVIFVLDGRAAAAAAPAPAPALPAAATAAAGVLRWPLAAAVAVASPFGARDGRPHEGIDLPVPIGTPVLAAAGGRVVYAGDGIRGYGNLVVLEHAGGLLTVYAHNSELLVRPGDVVAAGARVALSGQSGHATGPHLHFEVRQGQIPRDPMQYLPPSRTEAAP